MLADLIVRLPPCTCCGQPVFALRLCVGCGHSAASHGASSPKTKRKPCSFYDHTGPCPCTNLEAT